MTTSAGHPARPVATTIEITAAVARGADAPFTLERLELETDLRPDEVLVRIVATGVCQTDVHVHDGHMPTPMPAVLGHEGAGVVDAVGAAVTAVAPGDHVALSFASCGNCRSCLRGRPSYCERFLEANFAAERLDGTSGLRSPHGDVRGSFFGQSSFATHALATDRNVVRVPHDVPLELLAPMGCGLQTGAGAVLESLAIEAAASVAVLGTGTVGLAAVMAAAAVGASPIIAVDVLDDRLALAAELGATHTINGAREDTAARLAEITGRGVDYVLEVTGLPQMLTLAVDALAPMGTVGLIGGSPIGTHAAFDTNTLLIGRSVRGISEGDSVPQVLIPRLIELYRAGRFPFDRLIRFYDLADIETAVADLRSGAAIKPVLRMPPVPPTTTNQE